MACGFPRVSDNLVFAEGRKPGRKGGSEDSDAIPAMPIQAVSGIDRKFIVGASIAD